MSEVRVLPLRPWAGSLIGKAPVLQAERCRFKSDLVHQGNKEKHMEHEAYTRFTVEIRDYEGVVDKVIIERNHSEMNMEEVFDTFRLLAIALSFSPALVDAYFNPCDECDLVVPPDA